MKIFSTCKSTYRCIIFYSKDNRKIHQWLMKVGIKTFKTFTPSRTQFFSTKTNFIITKIMNEHTCSVTRELLFDNSLMPYLKPFQNLSRVQVGILWNSNPKLVIESWIYYFINLRSINCLWYRIVVHFW